jgi:PAS domain-containing protein
MFGPRSNNDEGRRPYSDHYGNTVTQISDAFDRRRRERRSTGRRLTDRQAAILELVASGLENKEIAHHLGISEQAVKEHVSNLLRLLSAPNRAALGDAAATRRFIGTSELDPEWLTVLFLDAPVLMALLEGPDHRFVTVNDAYRRAAGPRELVGRTFREAFPDLDEAGLVLLVEDAYRTGEPRRASAHPARWYRKSGDDEPTLGFLTMLIQPMRRADSAIGGVVFYAIDVTDQVRAAEAAKQLSAERDAILAQLPSGVIAVDRDGVILNLNEEGRRIVAFEPDGKTRPAEILDLRDITTGAVVPRDERPLARALTGRVSPERDYLGVIARTGERVPLRISAAPLFSDDGQVRGAVSVFTKISRP